ncbi:MAG: hypothetical protein IJ206_09405 [Oscillospiraceae bacterium]|nr:hypothetical protein [Oscillospiraceae bacterium]
MDVTVIIALIAAISAIIAPVVTALINHRSAYRVKTTELYFVARADSFRRLLGVASHYPVRPSADDMQALQDASAGAMLFSSPDTQEKIALYVSKLMGNDYSSASISALSDAHKAAILAMQSDLRKYHV